MKNRTDFFQFTLQKCTLAKLTGLLVVPTLIITSVLKLNAGNKDEAVRANATKQADSKFPVIQATKLQVKGISLVIRKEDARLDSGETGLYSGGPNGTELTILLSRADKRFVGYDDTKSKIISFTDEKNFDLTKITETKIDKEQLNSLDSEISKDGRSCLVTFTAPKPPSTYAEKIHLKANLTLRCGSEPKTVEQIVSLKVGSQFSQMPLALKVTRFAVWEDPEGGMIFSPNEMDLTLESKQNLDRIIKIAFIDSRGKAVVSRFIVGSYSSDIGSTRTYTARYGLTKPPKQARMKITYYSKIESLSVPLNLTYGVGL